MTRPADPPWLFRTYAGHTSARETNALFRGNLERGQTGLSVAFDLPTQIGHDADDPLAAGEVGRVGVPIGHLGDMRALFDGIPLDTANTSMTINATAMWLFALYTVLGEEQGVSPAQLAGTTQNDIIKEYLVRGTYAFPPGPSMRLCTDLIAYTVANSPRWNPINVCSYHYQEAGATPVQEIAYSLCAAIAVLDAVRDSGQVDDAQLARVVGRVSFFLNAGIRFVEEMCKMRAFASLWEEITRDRYGVTDPLLRRFRYGVQVNSLGLTATQPENNLIRIVLEMLGATLSHDARARAVQLPAWNEALGLPSPWDQQWSLRAQQILALESDLLEYDDLFAGSTVVESKVRELVDDARQEMERILAMGGAVAAVESGYLKEALVAAHATHRDRVETGEQVVVGINRYTDSRPSPLPEGGGVHAHDRAAGAEAVFGLDAWRATRDSARVSAALRALQDDARSTANLVPATLECARAGVTTGEWAATLREVFGDYRAPTGLPTTTRPAAADVRLEELRRTVEEAALELGEPLRLLVGKPGLDGHSNGAEQLSLRAAEAGFEVVYDGIRHTPADLASVAAARRVHCVGLSVLSGAHLDIVPEVLRRLAAEGAPRIPVVVGGPISGPDEQALLASGVTAVFSSKDHDITVILARICELIRANAAAGSATLLGQPR